MSFEYRDGTLTINNDATGKLIVSSDTKLIPIVQEVSLANVDLAFPQPSLSVDSITNTSTSTGIKASGNRAWRAHAWGLVVNKANQSGYVNLAVIGAGLSPNIILGNVRMRRTKAPTDKWGPFIKSVPESQWMPMRSGVRLEYNSWLRRIAWLQISGGYLRLYWKQSTRLYNPNKLDSAWESSWPERWKRLDVPPAYQIGDYYKASPAGEIFPPPAPAFPAVPAAADFTSTWTLTNIRATLCQL